jgi:hypothetical protein
MQSERMPERLDANDTVAPSPLEGSDPDYAN